MGVDRQLDGKPKSPVFDGGAGFEVGDESFGSIGEEKVEGAGDLDVVVDNYPLGHAFNELEAGVGDRCDDRFDVCLIWLRGFEVGVDKPVF